MTRTRPATEDKLTENVPSVPFYQNYSAHVRETGGRNIDSFTALPEARLARWLIFIHSVTAGPPSALYIQRFTCAASQQNYGEWMSNIRNILLSMGIVLLFVLPGHSQTAPCQPGTLANVLGTSCSVGPVIFNFDTVFSGNFFTLPSEFGTIFPGDIGFVPIRDGDRVGFKLVTNFTDGVGGDGAHQFAFGYTPQAAPGFDLRRQELNMAASVQGAPSDFVLADVVDTHVYPVSGEVFL